MKIDINSIGYRWKGLYSPYLSYIDGDVVYQNGSALVYRGGTFQNFALGQQDALLAGYLLNGGVSVGGRAGQVLHSDGASGVGFRFEGERGGTIATALMDTFNGNGCNASDHNMMTIMNEGMVRAWGRNYAGSLGIGRPDDIGISQPRRVAFPSNAPRITAIHACWNVTFFIGEDQSLWVCGCNDENGTGTGAERDIPVKLNGYGDLGANTKVAKVFSGYDYYGYRKIGCIDTNGYVYMWGTNNYGSCGWGTTDASAVPKIVPWSVQNPCKDVWTTAGEHAATMFIKLDGSAYMAGETNSTGLGSASRWIPTRFNPWDTSDPVKKFGGAESDAHWAPGAQYYRAYGALLDNGDLYMWGDDSGQVGGGWGTGFSGTIYPGEPNFPLLCLTNVEDFYSKGGGYHSSIALLKDGTVKGTGSNGYAGTVTDGTTWQTIGGGLLTGVTKLRALGGTYGGQAMALRSDGRCVSWGNENGNGIQGTGTTDNNVGGNWQYVLLDKTIIDFQLTGTTYGGNSDSACFFLCSDGTVYQTGQGTYGQGGSRVNNSRFTPNQIIF
jgi:alpha-tubulin suppressor-like RCC1 family protein